MKIVNLELSIRELENFQKKIIDLKKDFEEVNKKVEESLADYAAEQIEKNLATTQFKDGNEDASTFKEIRNGKTIVGMRGSQVLYNEFGTGTQGERKSHPLKKKYPLAGYNTGKRIRKATSKVNDISGIPVGEMYWTYKDKSGNTVFTQGIPAGKQVFNAAISLQKKKKEIIKKEVRDALSKL